MRPKKNCCQKWRKKEFNLHEGKDGSQGEFWANSRKKKLGKGFVVKASKKTDSPLGSKK